ncbi:MAG: permease prefix domain 1-containing protein [Lachnospiraceae bacterium]|nr:permease prefix domain 1-containing protein [Lachnospiraceae bacterium]
MGFWEVCCLMDERKFETDAAEQFLDEVEEQISYKTVKKSVRRELEEHIMDRTEAYEKDGFSHEQAVKKAVQNMGDAVSIGIHLNEIHHVQKTPGFLILTGILLLAGFGYAGYMQWTPEQEANGFWYYIPGVIVLAAAIWKGYPVLVYHRKKLMFLLGCFYAMQLIVFFSVRFGDAVYAFRLGTVTNDYFAVLLSALIGTFLLYRFRQNGERALLVFGILLAAVYMMQAERAFYISETAVLVLYLSAAASAFFMVYRRILSGRRIRLYAEVLAGCLLFGGVLMETGGQTNLQVFLRPEQSVESTWDDAYNGILIRELLGRTPLTRGLSLSPEEMMDYGTGAWYFASRDEQQIGHRIGDAEDVALWDILPQHSHNNYLIAVTIFQFGWLAGLLLVGGIGVFYVWLFSYILRIWGQMASVLSWTCGMLLLWQSVLYILGNFGYQYATFPNLPLISEGRMSILVHMMLLGFILSSYRYDRVVDDRQDTEIRLRRKEG